MRRCTPTLLTLVLATVAHVALANATTSITVGADPGVAQLSPDGSTLYVSHKCHTDGSCGGPIELIDIKTHTVKQVLKSRIATALVPAADGHMLYTATDDLVDGIYDPASSNTTTWAVDVWSDFVRPIGVALSPDQKTLYVALEKVTTPREIGVFDTTQGIETHAVVVGNLITDDIQVSPDGKKLYGIIYDGRAEQLAVIDTILIGKTPDVMVKRIKLGEQLMPTHALRVSPDGKCIYISAFHGLTEGILYRVDAETDAVKTTLMPHAIIDMQLSANGKTAYELVAENLRVVDIATGVVQQDIPLTLKQPERLTVDAAGKTAYVTEFSGDKVTVISL
jgi:DNA-binding beta-propeller fold protein YncE